MLQAALDEQRELVRSTQSDYETLQVESHAKDESNKKKIVDLTREVDVLKNQLKKYVAAVQMLRKDKILSEEAKEGRKRQYSRKWDRFFPFSFFPTLFLRRQRKGE